MCASAPYWNEGVEPRGTDERGGWQHRLANGSAQYLHLICKIFFSRNLMSIAKDFCQQKAFQIVVMSLQCCKTDVTKILLSFFLSVCM